MLKRNIMSLYHDIYQDEAFSASKGFIWKFMQRNRLTTRTVTGVGQKIPKDAPELCEQFLDDMQQLSNRYDIILNADETTMYFDLPASKTIDLTGVQSVIVKTTGHEKLRYTVFLTSGVQIKEKATKTKPPVYHAFRLPPLIIFRNLVKPPKGKFPPGMVVLGTKGGSTTEQITLNDYIPKVLPKRPG